MSATNTFPCYHELGNVYKYVYCCHVTETHDVIHSSATRTVSLGHDRNMLMCTFVVLPVMSCRYPRAEGVST
jgi:hypothetical protein